MDEPSPSPASPSRAAILEGAPAEAFVTLATGSALTAWALAYDASPLYLATLQSLFVGMQVLQPAGAWLTQRLPTRRLAIAAVLVSRLSWLLMSAAALLAAPRTVVLPLLIVVACLSAAAHVLRENALGTWLGDIVPAHARGRFFAQRSRVGVAAATTGSLVMALLFDGGLGPVALALVAAVVALLGLLSAWSFTRMPAPSASRASRVSLREVWADPRVHPYLHYQLLFGFAVAPGLAFFSYWVLDRMEGTFLVLSGHAVLLAVARIAAAPLLGRLVDRNGARVVLAACSAGTALMPLLWITLAPGALWPLALDAVVAGTLWGGHAIAAFDTPLRISTPASRPQVLALGAVAAGAGWILGSLFFGRLAEGLQTAHVGEHLRWVFGLCALARVAAGLTALRITPEPAADPDWAGTSQA
jgi:MFS family permease